MNTAKVKRSKWKPPVNGRAKGQEFERKVCKRLSLWITRGADDSVFWRSVSSGARSTNRAAKKGGRGIDNEAGDIMSTAPAGHPLTDVFAVECKTYRTLNLEQVFFTPFGETDIGRFWAQSVKQARSVGRWPLLIAKQNQRREIVFMLGRCYEELALMSSGHLRHIRVGDLVSMHLDELLAFDPSILGELKTCLPRPRAILLS